VGAIALGAVVCAGVCYPRQSALDPEASEVVDALLSARAAADFESSWQLLADNAVLSTSDEGFQSERRTPSQFLNEWMSPDDRYRIGALHSAGDDTVEWSETGVRREVPSWENNLNATMDGNEALWSNAAAISSDYSYARTVRVVAVNGKIISFTISDEPASNPNWLGALMWALLLPALVLSSLLLGTTSTRRRDSPQGRLMIGLQARFGHPVCDPATARVDAISGGGHLLSAIDVPTLSSLRQAAEHRTVGLLRRAQ
jgi:hypothetical protein